MGANTVKGAAADSTGVGEVSQGLLTSTDVATVIQGAAGLSTAPWYQQPSDGTAVNPFDPSHAQYVNNQGLLATYSCAINAHAPAATPTDWFTIQGSATKVIRITRIMISLRATAANQYRCSLIKYSVYLTGGTGAAATIVPLDSSNAAATAIVTTWASGLPTPGSAVGKIADDSLPVAALGTPVINNEVSGLYDFGVRNTQPIVLRGIAQYLAINSNAVALPSGFVADVRVEWTESAT